MAQVTKKTQDVKYALELTEREANALTELLLCVSYDGEGEVLDDIYAALCEAGAESDKLHNDLDMGHKITITRDQ